MLRPNGAHLLIRREFAPGDFFISRSKISLFFGSELNRRQIGIKQHHLGNFVLPFRGEATGGLNGLIQEFRHHHYLSAVET